jgi:hypothetical protein
MLGKEGHGRTVQFRHFRYGISSEYKKPCHLLEALKRAASLEDLLLIARIFLKGVYPP